MSILVITNQTDITSDFIIKRLKERKLPFYRLNTETIGRFVELNFNFESETYSLTDNVAGITVYLSTVTGVYYRRPEINRNYNDLTGGEQNFIFAELSYTLEALYKILDKAFWVNKVQAIRNAENKMYQLMVAKQLGLQVPAALVTNEPEAAITFFNRHDRSCIIKPIKSGLVQGGVEEGVIFTSKVDINENNVARIRFCPVYLQPLIKKKADIRVTVVGDKTFTAKIHSQDAVDSEIDWRQANRLLDHSVIDLPKDVQGQCIQLVKKLGLVYGAIDFILDENDNYIFLEINPNGQWAWIENRLNLNISHGITDLFEQNLAVSRP
jgi:glutathione synthase/RimK-type ligase-like ATP-grasp enzyme